MKTTHRDYLVYLAGPICGLTSGAAQDWRKYVAANLPEEIQTMSPMRGMDFDDDVIMDSKAGYASSPITTDRGVTVRDYFDCMRADLILVNVIGATKASIGTCIELGWANAARKPIVLVMEYAGNPHDHNMIREIVGFHVDTLDEGISLVEAILMPSGRGTMREARLELSRSLDKTNLLL